MLHVAGPGTPMGLQVVASAQRQAWSQKDDRNALQTSSAVAVVVVVVDVLQGLGNVLAEKLMGTGSACDLHTTTCCLAASALMHLEQVHRYHMCDIIVPRPPWY